MGTDATRQAALVYFDAVARGDMAEVEAMLADDVSFWVPPSLPDGVVFRGRAAVLRLFAESVALYDTTAGLSIDIRNVIADDDRAAVELVIRGRAAAGGGEYENWYHFLMRVHDGRIVEIREHLDSLYAYERLFVPAGITERSRCTWLP